MKKFAILCVMFLSALFADERNEVIMCENGLEMFEWQLKMIPHAQHCIESSACFAGGKILQDLLTAIEERLQARPQLKAYLLMSPVFSTPADLARVERMQRMYRNFQVAHAASVATLVPSLSGYDNHLKMLVVDGTYFTTGGTNLHQQFCTDGTFTPYRDPLNGASDMMSAGVRDQDVVGRGPVAQELRSIFHGVFAIWQDYEKTHDFKIDPATFDGKSHYFPLKDAGMLHIPEFDNSQQKILLEDHQIKVLFGGPHQSIKAWDENPITKEYVKLISEAEDEILIGNLYVVPPPPIEKALMDAINRGVKVTIITNGVGERAPYQNQFFAWANRVNFVPFMYGRTFRFAEKNKAAQMPVKKTAIYEYDVGDVLYHKKVLMVDRKYFVIGTYNIGLKSHQFDYEIVLRLEHPKVIEQAFKIYQTDLQHSAEVTPEKARYWYFDPICSYKGEMQKRLHAIL